MKSIKGTQTEQNLLKSFAGESQARNRYSMFAAIAKKEGFEQIAAISPKQPTRSICTPKNSSVTWKAAW